MVEITVGCNLPEYRSNLEFQKYDWINLEDLMNPGYLNQDHQEDVAFIRKSISGRRIIMDGPYIDLNMGSPEPACRTLAQTKVRAAISYAVQCGAEEIVFLSTFLPFIGVDFYERQWVDISIESWSSLFEGLPLQENKLQISLGNAFEFTPDNLVKIVDAIACPDFGLAFDVGHCLAWGKLDAVKWYQRIRDHCRVIYLHSNEGDADKHASIRSGSMFQEAVLDRLLGLVREDSILILKYFDKAGLGDDIAYLRDRLAAS
jgi:sugar phosphate isomerase/epimerase